MTDCIIDFYGQLLQLKINGLSEDMVGKRMHLKELKCWIFNVHYFSFWEGSGVEGIKGLKMMGSSKTSYLNFDILKMIIVPIHQVNFLIYI